MRRPADDDQVDASRDACRCIVHLDDVDRGHVRRRRQPGGDGAGDRLGVPEERFVDHERPHAPSQPLRRSPH
jgi:hypothetical protein